MDFEQYIKTHFSYNKDGTITRDDRIGKLGTHDKDGYLKVKVKKKSFFVHRIVWLLNNGHFPNGEIDHINRNRTDNRIENLRIADRITQCRNVKERKNPITGEVGIHIDNTKGLVAKYAFRVLGKSYRCRTLAEAVKKRKELRGEA